MTNAQAPRTKAAIVIVDDHPLVRLGLAGVINGEPDMQVCGEAASAAAAVEVLQRTAADLVITDLSLTDGNGLDLVKRLRARDPHIKILVCSMHDETLFAHRALQAGANGYIGKEEATQHVAQAIRDTLAGKTWLSETMTQRAINGVGQGTAALTADPVASLSDRELEVFEMIGRGLGPSQIALQIHLSVKTIETHREKIKRKLNLSSGSELLRRAMQWVNDKG